MRCRYIVQIPIFISDNQSLPLRVVRCILRLKQWRIHSSGDLWIILCQNSVTSTRQSTETESDTSSATRRISQTCSISRTPRIKLCQPWNQEDTKMMIFLQEKQSRLLSIWPRLTNLDQRRLVLLAESTISIWSRSKETLFPLGSPSWCQEATVRMFSQWSDHCSIVSR